MPESSAWPDIRRWELQQNEELFDEEDEEEVVVHNELYVSENEEENEDEAGGLRSRASGLSLGLSHGHHSSTHSQDFTLRVAAMEEEEDSSEERQSHISGISQQDRDNKTILLRQAASGMYENTLATSLL